MSDLGDNIRRIAGVKELKRKIDELQDLITSTADKAGIGKHISTAYGSGGAVGSNTVSTDDRDTDKATAAGQGAGGADSSNGYTADTQNLFDNRPALGAKIESLGGFFDCATGDEAKINFNGKFDPEVIPGIANEGTWSGEASADPRESQFKEGTWYSTAGANESTSPVGSVEQLLPSLDSNDPGNAPHTVGSVSEYDPAVDTNVNVTVNRTGASSFEQAVNINTTGCTVGVDAWCPTTDNRAPYIWASDAIHNIAFDGAQFLTSGQEPDADKNNKWDNNSSSMSGCDASGNAVTLTPDLTGGVNIDYTDTDKSITVNNAGFISKVEGTW